MSAPPVTQDCTQFSVVSKPQEKERRGPNTGSGGQRSRLVFSDGNITNLADLRESAENY